MRISGCFALVSVCSARSRDGLLSSDPISLLMRTFVARPESAHARRTLSSGSAPKTGSISRASTSVCTRRPKCGPGPSPMYTLHPLVVVGDARATRRAYRIAHVETSGSRLQRASVYRRQWYRRDARQEGGRIKCLTADTMPRNTHARARTHTDPPSRARLSRTQARIVTSVAKRLTTKR